MNKQKADLSVVEDEIYSKRKTVRYDIRDLTVEAISDKYNDSLDDANEMNTTKKYNYIYIPEYQRDFTWDEVRQSKLIESIVLGLPIPFIFVAENRDSSWEIVDGSQRIRTIHAFINNQLRLEGLKAITSLNGYTFSELDKSRQGKILNTALRISVLSEETSDDIKKDMFERINRGSDLLKPMEKRKGIYTGPFTTFIYQYCSSSEAYRNLIKIDRWLIHRQEHEELLLRFFALTDTAIYDKGISSGIGAFLDEYLRRKNEELQKLSAEEVQSNLCAYGARIDAVVEYVAKNFPFGFCHKQNHQTKRGVFEAISVGVWLALNQGTINPTLDQDSIKTGLLSSEFMQYAGVANELHKKQKLHGRVMYIYNLVTDTGA